MEKKISNLTREEHRKMFEGNIHVEMKKLKHRETEFDFKTPFCETKIKTKIKKEIKEVLEKLSKEYKLGIISSAREYSIEGCLDTSKMSGLFSFIYGRETHKIKVDKFEKVLREKNLKAEECLFVTDTLGDILEANKVGIKTIAVDFGYHEKERLQKGNPMKIISNFNELISVVEKG